MNCSTMNSSTMVVGRFNSALEKFTVKEFMAEKSEVEKSPGLNLGMKFGVEISCNHVKDFMFYHLLFHFMDDAVLHLPIYYSNNHEIPFYLQMEANENFAR